MTLRRFAAIGAAALALSMPAAPAQAQDDYIGEIVMFGFNFCPRDTAPADGRLLPISQYTALFALLGTTYGGDGQSTFALPDLRGRTAIGLGQGPGLSARAIGQSAGTENTTLTVSNLPPHNHSAQLLTENTIFGDSGNPQGNALARTTNNIYSDNAVPTQNGALHPGSVQVGLTGSGQPVNLMQPFLAVNYCIVTQGLFPSRP